MSGWFAGIPMRPVRPLDEATKRTVERVARALEADWTRTGDSMKPSIGRIVHVNIGTPEAPVWRAAIVTNTFGGDLCNATIFLDGHNDAPERLTLPGGLDRVSHTEARGYSRPMGEGPGCWRWPPRE